MDFSLGDDRRMMADSLSRYFADTLGWEARQAAAESEAGFSRDMWAGLAELGVLGMLFGEEAGGYGRSRLPLASHRKDVLLLPTNAELLGDYFGRFAQSDGPMAR